MARRGPLHWVDTQLRRIVRKLRLQLGRDASDAKTDAHTYSREQVDVVDLRSVIRTSDRSSRSISLTVPSSGSTTQVSSSPTRYSLFALFGVPLQMK